MADGQFDKDFGYLMPFLDKVAAAAGNLQDAASREELQRLMSEEKTKWARIRQLLSGAQASSIASVPQPQAKQSSADNAQAADGPTTQETYTFTVGSLRHRKE